MSWLALAALFAFGNFIGGRSGVYRYVLWGEDRLYIILARWELCTDRIRVRVRADLLRSDHSDAPDLAPLLHLQLSKWFL